MHDLLIRGGTVVDGTGAPARTADVAVTGGTITEVGRLTGAARRTIDADGLLVTPGFVDPHTHYDGQATWDPHLTPSCWHGVTTAILGNCGIGFAPVAPGRREWLIELMEGVEDIPGSALSEGIRWEWETFPQYLDALEAMPRAVDVGTHLPHAALRAYVMGERAQDAATEDDLTAITNAVAQGLQAGALGFSSGRTAGHRDARGGIVPGTYADEVELAAILAAMEQAGHGTMQIVPAGISGELGVDRPDAMADELGWLLRYGETYSRPITFLVMQSTAEPELWREWFSQVRAANDRGAQLRPQVGNRCFGVLMGHQSRMNPLSYFPTYRRLADLPFAERMRRLADPSVKAELLGEQRIPAEGPAMDWVGRRTLANLFPLGDQLDYEPGPQRSIAAIAESERREPWDVLYDRMLSAEGHDFLLYPLLNYGEGSYDGLYDMMSDPMTVQGLGDGGAHCALICDASMPTYMLSHWVRDRTRGPRLPLELAVKRLTADPADLYGLGDRGRISPGRKADLNVIDAERIGLLHPELVCDLPAGAGRLIQRSTGYLETLVSGRTVVSHGELTDERPGALVRGPR